MQIKTRYSDARSIVCHIVNASASKTTINQVSRSGDAPTEGTVRYRLRSFDLEEVQHALNRMLKSKEIKTLPRRALSFAIDFALIPFYGEEGDTVRSKAREGTTRFFAYASIYLMLRNKRYTLAVKHRRGWGKLMDVVAFLLREVEEAGLASRGYA